jgi:hypothetical protein
VTRLQRHRALADESGAVLIFALIVVTVVSLVVGGLLFFADTSLRTTVALRAEGGSAATADGAAQAAINTLRLSPYNNDTSSSTYPKCFGTTDTKIFANLVPGTTGAAANSAAVTCSPDPNTGAAGGLVPITAANKPGNAILTLGTNPAEDGLNVKSLNNGTLTVHGGIVSDSNINVVNGTLQSNTTVYAHSGCSGTIVSTPPPTVCNAATAADPGYAPEALGGTIAYRPVPANVSASCPGGIVTFDPGYYDDAAALSGLMSGNGACGSSVWWFRPGVYYFDFQNSSGTVPGLTGNDQWLIKAGQLIAGTPTSASGAVLSQPQNPATVPGACQNPIKSTSAVGVQFIFGGDSQLQVGNGADAEICGTYYAGKPPIVAYGLKSNVSASVSTTDSAATSVSGVGFAPSSSTLPVVLSTASDGKLATWTYTAKGGSKNTGSLALSAFAPPTIPSGSTVTAATMRIVYGVSPAVSSRTVTITPASGAPTTTTLNPGAMAAGATQSFPISASLARGLLTSGSGGASMAYTSVMSGAGTESIDAILLDLTSTVTVRAETAAAVPGNCLAKAYTGGSGGQCAVLSTGTSFAGRFYMQGTTYVPIAPVDLTLNNITSQVFRFGVIARTLWIKETGSVSYTGPVIEIPDNSPGYGPGGTVVYLTVYVCPASSTCSSSIGRLSLRARVYIYDPSGSPSPPARQMTVQSWATLR